MTRKQMFYRAASVLVGLALAGGLFGAECAGPGFVAACITWGVVGGLVGSVVLMFWLYDKSR